MSLGADTFKRNSKVTQKRAKSRVLAAACVLAAVLSGKSLANEANDALLAADRAVVAQAIETVENEARRLTRLKIREDTELKKFPLYCPKCRQENLIEIKQFKVTVITEPDAKTQSR